MRWVREGRERVVAWMDRYPVGRFCRFLCREVQQDDIPGLASQMAYGFLFAFFPTLLFMVAVFGFVGDVLGLDNLFNRLLRGSNPLLPAQGVTVVRDYVAPLLENHSPGFLTLGLAGAIWGAASGVGALSKGLCRAYHVQNNGPFWRRQSLSLFVILTLPPVGLLFLGIEVVNRTMAGWLVTGLDLGRRPVELLTSLRWMVLVLLLFFGISLLYHVLPPGRRRYVWSLPGSAVATMGWVVLTSGLGLYLENFHGFDLVYGSFGAVIVFLMWLYLVGLAVLLGAEINAHLEPGQQHQWAAPAPTRPK